MAEDQYKRATAYKMRIADILSGMYMKEEGWTASYVLLPDGRKIARANVLGTVVAREDMLNFKNIILDDATGRIALRLFEPSPEVEQIEVGDAVMLIGRPREFGGEKYFIPEILKKIEDARWIQVRMMELATPLHVQREQQQEQHDGVAEEELADIQTESLPARIYQLIRKQDAGAGADAEEVIQLAHDSAADAALRVLLEEGEIFEIRPGKVKVLE